MTDQQTLIYKAALKEARESFDRATRRLEEISVESYELGEEVTRLRRTITALAAMCSEEPWIDGLGITESCEQVMTNVKGTVTTLDVVKALEEMGFDLASQKNASASVHAVLSRLAGKKFIQKITDEEKKSVSWRGPNYDAEYDRIPF